MTVREIEAVNVAELLEQVIRDRKTSKVLADAPLGVATDRAEIEAIVANAGWAPFHRPAAAVHAEGGGEQPVVPWRCFMLDVDACRSLRDWLLARGETGPMTRLLAACSAMVLATWLPNPWRLPRPEGTDPDQLFEGTLDNMEHLAAASAAVQNILLSATARGYRSFWATGGPIRTAESLARIGVPNSQLSLGCVFLFGPDSKGAPTKPGPMRERRGAPEDWSRWVK